MKFIHLSDLHIGKRVYEFSMLEDQNYILNQILELVKQEKPDGVLIAGDIYDKPVPAAEAVQVFDRFLTRLAELDTSVFIISGNHDSAERIAFGAQLMSSRGVYLSPVYDGTVRKICLEDEYGEVWIHLLPFIRPASVRRIFGEESQGPETENQEKDGTELTAKKAACEKRIETWNDALETVIAHMEYDPTKRNVLLAHQFVAGAQRCDSEERQVGGLDQVDAAVFADFDYVALGHLHSPQQVGREAVRYCGTPLKYSFSEAGQQKSLTVIELKEKGAAELRMIPLVPLRDMRKIKGTYLELTALSFYENTNTEDYIEAVLTDEEEIPGAVQKLRIVYPNLMHLEYDNRRTRESREISGADPLGEKTELELFGEFYELQNNQPMSEAQTAFTEKLLREICDR